ncbi:MAG: hypothetical protein COX48_05810 [bacterium (Candidatus Stahlbacteria) CG23_combo_of_CG06-09_8_20_14_all_34_7]|nr:MAG: hypothetical protein COX48_05810 [bacterium (Candidatus Stahlbacteria) CG23_combo_of_CG06-09_8_20_14_all_34_7]
MDKIIWDNTVSSYLLFLLSVISGAIISFAVFFFTRNFYSRIIKRIKSIIIIIILSLSLNIGSQFFDVSSNVYNFTFTLAKILYVISFTWLAIKLSYISIERIYKIKHIKEPMLLTSQIIGLFKKTSLFFFGIVALSMVFNILGFNVFSIITGLGIGGLAVALGAQEILANIFGGITIFISGIIKPNDFIEIENYSGYIYEIGMRTTKIKRLDGKMIIIPNSQIIKSTIVNYTNESGIIQTYMIPLTYSMKAEQIKRASEIVKEILEKDERITDKNSISVGFYKFDIYAVNLYVSFSVSDNSLLGNIKEDFHYIVKHRFDSEKIDFAYPTQTVELINKNQ